MVGLERHRVLLGSSSCMTSNKVPSCVQSNRSLGLPQVPPAGLSKLAAYSFFF
jgi:hypothetical protein